MSNRVSFDLTSVPEEWSIIPCGVFFKEKSIKNTEGEVNLSVYRDYGVIPKDSRDDNHNRVSEDTSNYKLVESGDFVLNKMKGWSGSLGVSEYRGIVSPSYTVLEPVREIHNKYFHYLLRSETYRQMYESLSYGVRIGQWELRYHDFKQIPSLYPPINEQKLISRYLDNKTEQIDSLIEKIHKKIELLKEQRTSLINQCVTKGLDPNVEMKDSGVEWIGEIPKHWDIKKFSYSFNVRKGKIPKELSDKNEEDSLPYLSMSVLRGEEPNEFSKESGLVIVNEGDIGLLWDGSNSGEIIKINRPGILSSTVALLSLKDGALNRDFSYYLLKFYEMDYKNNTIGMGIPHADGNHVRESKILIPHQSEQEQIVDYLDEQSRLVDKAASIEVKRIELLKELRKSFISSAVTGKVRVTEDMI